MDHLGGWSFLGISVGLLGCEPSPLGEFLFWSCGSLGCPLSLGVFILGISEPFVSPTCPVVVDLALNLPLFSWVPSLSYPTYEKKTMCVVSNFVRVRPLLPCVPWCLCFVVPGGSLLTGSCFGP